MSDISKHVVRNRPRSIVVVLRSTERGEREKTMSYDLRIQISHLHPSRTIHFIAQSQYNHLITREMNPRRGYDPGSRITLYHQRAKKKRHDKRGLGVSE